MQAAVGGAAYYNKQQQKVFEEGMEAAFNVIENDLFLPENLRAQKAVAMGLARGEKITMSKGGTSALAVHKHDELQQKLETKKAAAGNSSILKKQQLAKYDHDITAAKEDLLEYRSHLARHKSKGDFDAKELEELQNDTVVTSDYKMKILSCFFCENQGKWFGKRGTSCLGFMIVTNSITDGDETKDMCFVMCLTDDTTQDEWEVLCAKAMIYDKFLPEHISKVKWRSDGASCFNSKLQ